MMGGTECILEGLFMVKEEEEQKAKAQRCKVLCALGTQEREAFLAQVTTKLRYLLDHEPSHALLVSLRCDGCPTLKEVLLGSCWGDLLQVCCQHLGTLKEEEEEEEEPWPPPLFSCAVRVLYALLKEYSSQEHHQPPLPPPVPPLPLPIPHHKALMASHVALTKALLIPQALGSHALVASSALWLVLQHLEPQRATAAFLDTLWAVNYLERRRTANSKKEKVDKDQEEEDNTITDFEREYMKDSARKSTRETSYIHLKGSNFAGKRKRKPDTQEGKVEEQEEGSTITNHEEENMKENAEINDVHLENISHEGKKEEVYTPERKVKEQDEEVNTVTYHKEETVKKNTRRDTAGTKSIHLEEVKTAIEIAKKGEEGKKLMRRKFEELEESCYSSSTFLLQGMLNAGGKWLLKEEREEKEKAEEERYGGRVFLYSLHPLLLKLCSGGAAQHTYQAFQTLHLWLQSVRDLGTLERRVRSNKVPEDSGKGSQGVPQGHTLSPLLPHPSQEPLFSMAPGSQGPVFTLLNASWESPAKGVGEMVGRCMEEIFSLHEDGEKGTQKKLAKDMLEALLSSSATSSISCSSSSIWASKSLYPPLALALVHLGCKEALQLHPSLPSSLTYSLGVNHLAPPGTTVYKVFLAQLGEASWRNHFLAPVCKALCSQDRLTQRNVLSLWLPPTLRHYLDIHWALLAPCGSDTPSWLARMALLRVARSVGSLHLGREGKEVTMKATNRHKEETLRSARGKSGKGAKMQITNRHKDETLRRAGDKNEKDVSVKVTSRHVDETLRRARDENFESGTAEDFNSNKTSYNSTKSDIGNEDVREIHSVIEERSGSAREEREEEEEGKEEREEEEEDQEAVILHYITVALRHRDENVRLEAFYFLCQTHKTSQPVTPFEAQCLKSFLTHNMNIDSAPFRQGVLKCVAALMVRLRGATASQSKSHAAKEGAKGSKGIGKGHLESSGTHISALVQRDKRKGNGCDESSTSSWEINQDESGDPEGNKGNLQKCSSLHKVNTEHHQESVNLKRNQKESHEKNVRETTGKPFLAHNRNHEEEEGEKVEEEGVLATSASIVLWLVREAHRGMAPDSNYQRRILALQLYKEVLVALLPSVAHHRPGKRSNTSSEPLLTYLNSLALKGKGIWGDMDVVIQSHVRSSHKADEGTKSSIATPSDCCRDYKREKIASHHSPNQMKSINSDEKAKEKHLANQTQDIHIDKKAFEQQDVHGQQQAFQEPGAMSQLSNDEKASSENLANQTEDMQHDMKPSELQDIHEDKQTFRESLDAHGDNRALNQPLIDLKYPWTLTTLLHLTQDEMSDVRTESCEIIHLFASQGKMCLSLSSGKEWMKHALKLCDSPKASDAESGATLALTVARLLPRQYQREVLEDVFGGEMKGGGGGTHPPSLAECLLARVECQYGAAQSNLLKAARHTPIHGTLQALGRCITEAEEVRGREGGIATLPPELPHCLASLLQQLVEFVLNTLASTSPLGAAVPPSFAEMGEAVGRVVEKGKEEEKGEEMEKDASPSSVSSLLEEEEEEEGLLSSDHVLVLSCCWQILKSCCEVTSQAIHLFSHDPQGADGLIRAVVVRVLLGTRHKGAMEAARATYASLWANLLQSATSRGSRSTVAPRFVDVLHRQVGEVLSSLRSPSNTSVTRRAAGVAMMVQAACGAAPRTTASLLTATLTTLTTIASTEVALDETGTTDAPPALALHILQSLALHSPLGPFLQPHLTPLTSCCLHAFSSPSWAIRNAALQLFGSLVSCLVGQKKVRDDSSALNSLTVPEFLSRHPSLAHHLLNALEGDSRCSEGEDGASDSADDSLTQDTLKGFQDMDTGVHTSKGTEMHASGNTTTRMKIRNTTSSSKETHTSLQTSTYIPKHSEVPIKPLSSAHQLKPTQEQAGTHTPTHHVTQTHAPKPSQTQTGTHTSTHSETPIQPHTPSCAQNLTQTQADTHIIRASVLVPVLSLVARLSPGTGLQQNPKIAETLHRLWCSTACLLHSPVYSVRRLAALALVSLTPSSVAFKQACSIFRKASDPLAPTNLLNGLLMALCSFLQTHPKLAEDARLRYRGTKSLSWLLSPDNKCHVNTALALKIMMALGIKKVDTQHMPALDPSLPGAAECHLTHSLMELSLWPKSTIENLFLLYPSVDSDVLDGCSGAILAEIKECQHSSWLLRYERLFWYGFDDMLTPKAVAVLLSLLSAVMEKEKSAGMNLPKHRLSFVLSCVEGQEGSRATCAALVLTAHLLRKPYTTYSTFKAFTAAIMQHSHPTASEDHRLAASAALEVAIKPLLCQCRCADLVLREQLIVATVTLLQDEDSAIRDSAANIVVALLTPSTNISEVAPLTPSSATASKVSYKPLQLSPSPHPNLALYELLQWLAEDCMSFKNWGKLKILWHLCSGQARLSFSSPAMVVTGGHTRLFQSHCANLYQEPKQLSIMVGEAFLAAVHAVNRRCKIYDNLHENTENKEKREHIQEHSKIVGESDEHIPKNNEFTWKPDPNYCPIHKIHEKEQENSTILRDNQIQQENTRICPVMDIPDWLEEERLKLNSRGETLHTLTSEHRLWHDRLLATEAGVYVVACRVFQWLCDVFGVSTELAYPLEWGEEGYCVLDGVR